MARGHEDSISEDSVIKRRSYLKAATAAVAALTFTGVSSAQSAEAVNPSTVVNLGDEGLSNGDTIDSYLEEHVGDDVEVQIPAGEYAWDGDGFDDMSRNAAIVGQGDVVLNLTDGFNQTLRASGGTLVVKNITVSGAAESSKSRFRLEADSDGEVIVENLNFPDGSVEGAKSKAFYAPPDHAGSIVIRDCYIANFDDNGIYASSPGKGEDGRVVVERCVVQNNNISGIRVGSTDSVVRDCRIINDDEAPESRRGQLNMRGIRVREAGENITIENCDIVHSYEGAGAPIQLHEGADGGSGTISNVRILNNADSDAIYEHEDGVADSWEGENISITGDGDLSHPSHFDVCEGGSCEEPTEEEPQADAEDEAEEESEPQEEATEADVLTIDSGSTDVSYRFVVDGSVTPTEHDGRKASSGDDISEDRSGNTVVSGRSNASSYYEGDAYRVEGEIVTMEVEGDYHLELNGEAVSVEELGGSSESDAADRDSASKTETASWADVGSDARTKDESTPRCQRR
ncbi:right-handed parallel beta-helix repeat-containing protein (plasmid) [Haloferacaceae archaeon DSL9]